MTWRERAAAVIAEAKAHGEASGLDGLELRRYVRSFGPSASGPSHPLMMWRQEFARVFKGRDYRDRRRDDRRPKPDEGQGSLF